MSTISGENCTSGKKNGNRAPGKKNGNRAPGKKNGNRAPGKKNGNRAPGKKNGNHRNFKNGSRPRHAVEEAERVLRQEIANLIKSGNESYHAYKDIEVMEKQFYDAIIGLSEQADLSMPGTLEALDAIRDGKKNPMYKRRTFIQRTASHIGQLKLLLGEILFLALHGEGVERVIYAGAGPGIHLPMVFDLFPHISFVLIDPVPFARGVARYADQNKERITLTNAYFTDEMAYRLRDGSGEQTLFISDIRTTPEETSTECTEDFEGHVRKNMRDQANWTRILNAKASMLKFRLPYAPGETMYFAGDIYFQAWGPLTTTEGRIMVTRADYDEARYVPYDNQAYEESMNYVNSVFREWHHFAGTPDVDGMCDCFDCATELSIWGVYIDKVSDRYTLGELTQWASRVIGKKRGAYPHGLRLADPELRDHTRLDLFREIDEFEYKKYRRAAMTDRTGMY